MLKGIDISSWQEGIDIKAISKQCDFLIAKCSDGTYFKDKPFESYMNAACENGMLVGFYHYAEPSIAPEEQAEYFCNAGKEWFGKGIPVLDLEENNIGNWENFATRFMNYVEKKMGVRPILYISNGATTLFSKDFVKQNPILWAAEYWYSDLTYYENFWDEYPITEPWPDATIWQFTSSGRLDGFDGNLDLDYFYGTVDDWYNICGGVDMIISDEDIDKIAKRCAEYTYGKSDKAANLNMYNATHWAYSYIKSCYEILQRIAKKLGA